MTVSSSSSIYQTNTIYYPGSDYLTSSTKIMEPTSSTSVSSLSRTHAYSVFSPPELVHDDEEEDEEYPTPLPASPPNTPPSCLIMNQHRILKNSISASPITKRRKSIPQRSPSPTLSSNDWIFTWSPSTTTKQLLSFIPQQEQQYVNYSYQPRIIYLHQRKNSDPILKMSTSSISSPSISPSPSISLSLPNQNMLQTTMISNQTTSAVEIPSLSISQSSSPVQLLPTQLSSLVHHQDDPIDITNNTSTFSSGRPIRLKGPCQACHENSEACMRKAFNWPFPADEVYYDKGRPFVYLCNKCGLRYNKSGGSVCRKCRWVLCKEEKRKVIQLIDAMRSSRVDGKISLDEDIVSFVCTPKYWNCGQPWKIRWAVNMDDIQ